MSIHSVFFSLFVLLISCVTITAQSTYKTHSHNDYYQNIPFWNAYSNGASSIEVDLFLKNTTLYVTHEEKEIVADRTFEKLYLEPLKTIDFSNHSSHLQLLIDIKSEAYKTLDEVIAALKKYPSLLENKQLKFVISGNRPLPKDYSNYPEFIYFDHQNMENLSGVELSKVAMISRNFKDYSVWNGYGRMVAEELAKVKAVIAKANNFKIPIRFWATPDTKTAWNAFAQLGVDYINTDKPAEARIFLDKLNFNTYQVKNNRKTYIPKYNFDQNTKPKNIILMIGDGNGLAQITASMIANQGSLSVLNIKDLGLMNTASADDLATDSAAGATAMATGVKTNNRAIGVDPNGKKCDNLIELLSPKGYHTAIITTDAINGATPSSFYAHTVERDDTDAILKDLSQSDLDFFISGGKAMEKSISEKFKSKTLEEFTDFKQPTAVYFGDHKMPSIKEGRGNILPASTKKALEVLSQESAPFFLMIESAQIDNGGHANDVTAIINEMLDFDQAIGEVLQYADEDKNTLVIITADHETGGLGVNGGVTDDPMIRADFLSVDHTGILVPVFAYGPQSQLFRGLMDNTSIFTKIMEALNTNN